MTGLRELAKKTELLVLDFDGAFYQFSDAFEQHCCDVAAKSALKIIPSLTPEEALKLTTESYELYGTSLRLLRERYSIDIEDWHDIYHQELDHRFIETSQVTTKHLKDCPVPFIILSHASRFWILQMIKKFELDEVIQPEQIYALEDINYSYKMTDEMAYRFVLERLNVAPSRSIMVEDSPKNLTPAKTLGMTTVYVTQGKSFEKSRYPQVDHAVENLPEFFAAFNS